MTNPCFTQDQFSKTVSPFLFGAVIIIAVMCPLRIIHITKSMCRRTQSHDRAAPFKIIIDTLHLLIRKIQKAGKDHHQVSVFRSEAHTSELQSLMRISYAVFCLQKQKSPTDQDIDKKI